MSNSDTTGKFILAIDAGTTNVMAMVVDQSGRVKGSASQSYQLVYPGPRQVELDPEKLWQITLDTINQALLSSSVNVKDLAGIGITGQRSTIVIWERDTGKTVGPAVVWQDQRGKRRADELIELGFFTVNSITAASKLEQALALVPNVTERLRKNELAWGNVDSFIAWRISGGAIHVTDASNACATGFFDMSPEWRWLDSLLEVQNLPSSFFPEIVDSVGLMGHTDEKVLGAKIPISAIIGDQQSALYGQGCLRPGMAKISYGTSGTCDVNSGSELKLASGAYPAVAWTRGDERTFLVEGMVITAGAVFGWLRKLGILDDDSLLEVEKDCEADANGVSFLPALQGLGTPHNSFGRFGAFEGLTLATSKQHMIRAAMEGVAFRIKEMVDGIYQDSDLPRPQTLRVDGGASENDTLMQLQANVLGCVIERMNPTDATAYGVALLAGEGCGLWEPGSSERLHVVGKSFEPQWSSSEAEEKFAQWKSVFQL